MTEQENKLGRDLLHDASEKARLLLENAERESAALAAAAAGRRQARRAQRETEAEKAAGDRIRTLRAMRETEKRRRRLLAADQAIQSVLARAARQAAGAPPADRRASIEALLGEAAAALGGGDLDVHLRPEDLALLGETRVAALIRQAAGADRAGRITVSPDPGIGSGVILETADGKRRFDNTLSARRGRLDKSLRLRIARELGYHSRNT